MSWDNSGLQTGRTEREIKKVYVALDATDEVTEDAAAWGAELLITHHPLIFGSLKQITDRDFLGRRILRLVEHGIACYSMHTNYDVARMADLAAEKLQLVNPRVLETTLETETPLGIGKIGEVKETLSLEEYCERVKEAFGLSAVKVFGDAGFPVRQVALCPGSGKSVIDTALRKGADVLVTGDIDHHSGIDAWASGMAVIDAGHYGVERIFIEDVVQFMENRFPELECKGAPVCHPFRII